MKPKTLFYCTECGNETPKWAGKCPACGAWNTIVEQPQAAKTAGKGASRPAAGGTLRRARPVTELEADEEIRFSTGMRELDRVLGGGAVKGSLVLVGGAPGIGKSTLMLQICESLCRENKVLYVSGEESEHQLKLRARRLAVQSERLFVISETSLGDVLESVAAETPDVLIVDSIQTLYNDALESPAGSVSQVKDCTMALMQLAKGQGITVFVIGHVNKEGSIAGPKVLEHMVDCVLYFEGDQHTAYRILRAAKNRFGATNEIGVFEMRDSGLQEVENPSEMLLSGRPEDAPGTCVTCVMEGARPVLAEIQALAVSSPAGNPRRTSNGFDYNRFAMLLAVLEKRGGPEGLRLRRVPEHHRRIEPGRARGGPGGGDRPGLQLSGPAGAGGSGGHRGGGPHRGAAVCQPAGPADQRGPAAGLHPVPDPVPPDRGAGRARGASADPGAEYR